MEFLYTAAIDMIKIAHKDQVRKYTNEPYITHPFAVAGLVAAVTDDDDMIIASLLHDTVEDTNITIDMIKGIFGNRIASIVDDLTDISKPSDGNRAKRKAIDREHIANADIASKTIKLADLIDNTKTITAYDSEFAEIYIAEKRFLLNVLQDGNKQLLKIATDLVHEYYRID